MTENALISDERYGAGSGLVHTNSEQIDDGAGVFSDYYSSINDFAHGNWVNLAVDGAADAMDTLAFCEDPLQGLIAGGIGWLIEHVSFLSEPLDYLAGNPDFVQSKAQTWKNIKEALERTAEDYERSAQALLQQYQGTAATAYGNAVAKFTGGMTSTAAHADNAATAMTVAAAIVGTTRGLVRDWISTFVAQAIEKAVVALATSVLDFGASIAAFIADEVVEGSILAEKTAAKLTEIAGELRSLASAAERSAAAVSKATTALERDAAKLSRQTVTKAGQDARDGLADANQLVRSTRAQSLDELSSLEKGGFDRAGTAAAIAHTRQGQRDLEEVLPGVQSVRHEAEGAAAATGRDGGTLRNNVEHGAAVQNNIDAEVRRLTEQRRDLVAHQLHMSPEAIERLHLPLEQRLRDAAIHSSVDGAKHVPLEGTKQAVNERTGRAELLEEEQRDRGELPDGSLLEE